SAPEGAHRLLWRQGNACRSVGPTANALPMWASVGRLVPGYGARATGGAALGAWTQHPSGPLPARVPQHAAPRVDRGPNEPRIRSVFGMPELPSSGEPAGRSGVQPAL